MKIWKFARARRGSLAGLAVLLLMLSAPLSGWAQKTRTVTVSAADTSIERVINLLKERYGLSVAIKTDGLDLTRTVTVHAVNQPVETFFHDLFAPTSVEVTVAGNTVKINALNSRGG